MRDKLIQAFPISWLEHIFLPAGMLLVAKSASKPETTTVLVRGGAGTGKTTLAVAIAHAIAREQAGVVLFLTTEFVPTELVYKAKVLELPDGIIMAFRSPAGEPKPGAILAEHLLRTEAGAKVETSAQRKRAALQAVAEVLSYPTGVLSAELPAGLPVRAVVIDAFGLPETGGEDEERALRSDLVALMQALEREGVSTIVVEEATTTGADPWLPFVTDIVFELELAADSDTGALLRKLKCPKSRYKPALPGPHDYGLQEGKPCVWPDVLLGGGGLAQISSSVESAPPLFFPLAATREYVKCPPGTVLLSHRDKDALVVDAFLNTPGIRVAAVYFGPQSIVSPPEGPDLRIPEAAGPLSIAWTLLRLYSSGAINAVFLQEPDYFLERVRYRIGTVHMIAMLRAAGLLVCVHGRSRTLQPFASVADYSGETFMRRDLHRRAPARRYRRAARWFPAISPKRASNDAQPRTSWAHAIQEILEGHAAPRHIMDTMFDNVPSVASPRQKIGWATACYLLGQDAQAEMLLRDAIEHGDGALVASAALYMATLGDELVAAQFCFASESALLREIWCALCAVYGSNDAALGMLSPIVRRRASFSLFMLWALSSRRRIEEADHFLQAFVQQHKILPAWLVSRAESEIRLDSGVRDSISEGIQRLSALGDDATIPAIPRAEVFFNLGMARERTNELRGAIEAYERALALNPLLEAAEAALAELRV
ncbi:tetratricopeptide repeat protein (plasmid) [Sorangium sp. So ce119]|uniref:tetratricopeptide repeat protein n=1 Tax=Sorangium sp. So ce119 TaxID=3133279 RepID=UPI003F647D48